MTIAFDAKSEPGGGQPQTGDLSWTHTPAGTPRAVMLFAIQNTNVTDQTATLPTYGSLTLQPVLKARLMNDAGAEDAALYGYFAGKSVPTGNQTVNMDWDATGSAHAVMCVTVTAAADCEVAVTGTLESAGVANPSVTMSIGDYEVFVLAALHSGQDALSSVAVGSGYTRMTSVDPDFGTQVVDFVRRNTNFTGPGDVTVSWTIASEEAGILAVAIKEVLGENLTGPNFPGTVTTETTGSEIDNDWTSAGNISANDGSEASITAASYDAPDISFRLKAQNFGFSIPGDATINGVIVEIEKRDGSIGQATDFRVQLLDDTGVLIGNNIGDTISEWPTIAQIYTYGHTEDLWGATLTPTIVNDADFGVVLSVQAIAANTDIFVDFIRMSISWTAGAGGGTTSQRLILTGVG